MYPCISCAEPPTIVEAIPHADNAWTGMFRFLERNPSCVFVAIACIANWRNATVPPISARNEAIFPASEVSSSPVPLAALEIPPIPLLAESPLFSVSPVQAGPFSPAADQPGSNGVSASDPSIVEWANTVVNLTRGPVNITNPTGAKASFGTASNALGPADSTQSNPNNVVSLGDGGSITLSFAQPITNGAGADFAVFENGFPQSGVSNSYFLELATVAVSSDGVNFFTFPSVSLTPTTTQVGSYGTLDPTNLYNLAGSEIVGYGTPFNLDDLAGVSPLLNINAVTQIRVTDVIGNINTSLGSGTYTYDDASNPIFNGAYGTVNHIINDPYATPFNSGGFDLDAIGVLNVVPEPSAVSYLLLGLGAIIAVRRYSSVKSKV